MELEGLIVIGGEDTLSNCFHIKEFPQILISKTIDNDVGVVTSEKILNYFTLGHPTAAEKITTFVSLNEGLRTTAYSHNRIMVVESMGMHAGWLAMASEFGDPDFIIIPEFPLNYNEFKELVIKKYQKQKNLIIVISEGAKWDNGEYISANENEKDEFNHPRFKGSASILSGRLKTDLKSYFNTRNINFVNPSYLYRSGSPNELDVTCASLLGEQAFFELSNKLSESIFLSLKDNSDNFEVESIPITKLGSMEDFHRFVPNSFYDEKKLRPTDQYRKYLSKINFKNKKIKYGLEK